MALTRKMLKAMGIDEEKIDQIIEAHSETVDALKAERDGLKEKANKLDEVQKELDSLKSLNGEDWKAKHDSLKKDFENYKQAQAEKETLSAKKSAYRKIIEDTGIKSKKLVDLIINSVDFSKIELDGENIKDAEKLTETVKSDYAEYIPQKSVEGAKVENPINSTSKRTKEEILAIKDGGERRKAMAENAELFGIKEG